MDTDSPKVTVIVVSYNTLDLLRRCLASLRDVHEVIVVDNASQDGSCAMVEAEFPSVRLIRNSLNRGFGAANNQGLASMKGDLALCLNSDACAEPGAISQLASLFSAKDWVAAGGRLLNHDGSEQASCCGTLTLWEVFCEQSLLEKLFPSSTLFSPYWLNSRLNGDGPFEVEQCMGACLMFRPLERFDERFFLYCEDTELCLRLRRHGKIAFLRAAEFHHALGASSAGYRWKAVARYNRGKELYFSL
ncbi:MAG: glycosyltransferase family 2 protein, partial [Armatimonadota bacterium]